MDFNGDYTPYEKPEHSDAEPSEADPADLLREGLRKLYADQAALADRIAAEGESPEDVLKPVQPAENTVEDGDNNPPPKSISRDSRYDDQHQEAPEVITVEMVRQRCLDEVNQGLQQINAQRGDASHTGDVLDSIDRKLVNEVVLDKAREAVEAGDQAGFDNHLTTLINNQATADQTAEACYIGRRSIDDPADKALQKILSAEKLRVAEAAVPQVEFPAAGLNKVIELCEQQDLPPNEWIKRYATDPENAWSLLTAHHRRGAASDSSAAPDHAKHLETQAKELLEDDRYSPGFVLRKFPDAIQGIQDTDLRTDLLDRFEGVCQKLRLNDDTFDHLLRAGLTALEEPTRTDPKHVAMFERGIERCAKLAREKVTCDVYKLETKLWPWKLALKEYQHASPKELIEEIDKQTAGLLATDIPEKPHPTDITRFQRNRQYVVQKRDETLQAYARSYAEQGDYTNAHLFFSQIVTDTRQWKSLGECLNTATTFEHIATLTPDKPALTFNPDLHLQLQAARARILGNAETLESLAVEAVQSMPQTTYYNRLSYVGHIYDVLGSQNKQRAVEAAPRILNALRDANATFHPVAKRLSDDLIRSGDQQEVQRVYDKIDQQQKRPAHNVHAKWKLAQLIKDKPGV